MTDAINWGPTGQLVYERTYSRTKPDGTKETWPETVQRVVDGNLALGDPRHELPDEREDLIRMMTEFKVLPAGRHLWASGVQGRQYLFNCHVSGWNERITDHFEFTFMRLMEGGGVGANYSNKYLEQYPEITGRNGDLFGLEPFEVHIVCDPAHPDYQKMVDQGLISTEYVGDWAGAFEVDDSREGWAEALVDLINTYYRPAKNQNRVFDVSRVRPEGSRLKTFGGRASGPLPLAVMLHEVADVMNERIGAKLDGIGAMEIDHAIAKCVVSGGNRRSARMAIMHWNDSQVFDFINIKQRTGEHWTTNISVEVDDLFFENLDKYENGGRARKVLNAIAEGMLNNGEPGFWNSSLSNVGEPNTVVCTNPCLTGDTVIATVEGPRTFEELAEKGQDVEVYSWHPETKEPVVRLMRRPHKTAENVPVLEIEFDSGLVVKATPDHGFYSFRGKRVDARDLTVGQSVRAWSMSQHRDGHLRVHGWNAETNSADHQWVHRMLIENATGESIPDGLVVDHIDGNPLNNELENLQLLTPEQHNSKHYPDRFENGFDGTCRNHKVVAIREAGVADVYNGMVEDSHTYIILDPEPVAGIQSGIVSANCGEIALEEWENCNLGHVNLAAFVDPDTGLVDEMDMAYAHELVTRFLIRATYGDVNDTKQAEKLARNRRIGVGHLGVASFLALTGVKYSHAPRDEGFIDLLIDMSCVVDQAAATYAHDLRIPIPVKTRTVAPTGTIAKMPGVSEGIHPIFSKYFIRRIRFSDVDPDQMATVQKYRDLGYGVEPDMYAPQTTVVSFPTKDSLLLQVEELYGVAEADKIVESAADLSLTDMLEFQRIYQLVWADNAVSYTVNVDPSEYTVDEVAKAIRDFGPTLKGATVFPETSMPQSPYERITKADYELYEDWQQQVADGVDEACITGCPVK